MIALKEQINDKLKHGDFASRKDLVLWLAKEEEYRNWKKKDNQLMILDTFASIWMEEKKTLISLGITQDIFMVTDSLDTIEQKYRDIKYFLLRVDNQLPEDVCEDAMNQVLDWGVSGIALGMLIEKNSCHAKKNMLTIAKLLKKNGQMLPTILLLQYAIEHWDESDSCGLEIEDFLVIMREIEKGM